MESFFRYISYVDYYKKSEKIRNVGFFRWKLHNGEHRLELQVKNLYGVQGNFEIQEKSTGKIIGNLCMDQGIGNYVKRFSAKFASGNMYIDTLTDRLYLDEVEGFIIRMKEGEYLAVDLKLEQENQKNSKERFGDCNLEEDIQKENRKEVSNKEEFELSQKEDRRRIEEDKKKLEISYEKGDNIKYEEKTLVFENSRKKLEEAEAASENILIEGISDKYIEQYHLNEKEISERRNKKLKIIEPIHEDKWQELCKKYQQVHPFPGNKVFLSIKPEDFIILQQEYQKLVNNSFLLHGFYNYGHMILGKLSEEDGAPVYIGVPGVYYEREKQAAQMFGFAGFESTEQPVQAGSYGYYMIEVEI